MKTSTPQIQLLTIDFIERTMCLYINIVIGTPKPADDLNLCIFQLFELQEQLQVIFQIF